jgi:hypothetical protein
MTAVYQAKTAKMSGLVVSTGALTRYDAACRALAEAKLVDEVQQIRGTAEAWRAMPAKRCFGCDRR